MRNPVENVNTVLQFLELGCLAPALRGYVDWVGGPLPTETCGGRPSFVRHQQTSEATLRPDIKVKR
jgi:hypothetical protein